MLESHGICRALSYMVQAISAEPGFGAQLSVAPIRVALPSKWNIIGTSADFFLSVSAVPSRPRMRYSQHYSLFILLFQTTRILLDQIQMRLERSHLFIPL